MKKVLIGLVMMLSLHSFAQDNFYYYKDQKIPLQLNTQHAYLLTTLSSEVDLNKKLQGKASVVKFSQDIYQQRLIKTFRNSSDRMANTSNYFAEIKFNNILSLIEFKKELQALKNDPSIVSVSNCYNNIDNDLVAVTNYIWVGLKNEMDIMKLSTEASKINFSIRSTLYKLRI